MKLQLSENIRRLRKQRGITQQQLADTLAVTVAAVSKWERGSSLPDLEYLVKLAEIFQVSVDSLLGYQLKDVSLAQLLEQIVHCQNERHFSQGQEAVEQILERFPNHFLAAYRSGTFYMTWGISKKDPALARKAIPLLRRSMELFPENTDSTITQEEIWHSLSCCHLFADEPEEAVKLLQEHNPRNVHDGDIGMIYAMYLQRPRDAYPYLENALALCLSQLCRITAGYANAYFQTEQPQKLLDIWNWQMELLQGLKSDPDQVFVYDRNVAQSCVYCAMAAHRLGRQEQATDYLRRAWHLAVRFRRTPVYTLAGVIFDEGKLSTIAIHDSMDTDLPAALEEYLQDIEKTEHGMLSLWEAVKLEEPICETETK